MKKIIFGLLVTMIVAQANAQLKGDHVLGFAGLKAGSQAPPSVAFAVPVYGYKAHSLRDDEGKTIVSDLDLNMFVTGAGFSWVSDFKIFGANYGNSVLFAFAKTRIEGNQISSTTPIAFSSVSSRVSVLEGIVIS